MTPALAKFIQGLQARDVTASTTTPLPNWAELDAGIRQIPAGGVLTERFIAAAIAAGAQAQIVAEGQLTVVLQQIVLRHSLRTVLLGESTTRELAAMFEQAAETLHATGVTLTKNRAAQALFSADAAVTGVRAAVAETGSIFVAASAQVARGESLVPPIHIALVDRAQIVADLADLYGPQGPDFSHSSNATLITGPSKTADIEGVLVTGVHGPGHVYVLVN